MKRRDFITLLGRAAAAWPLAARAQQLERLRRVGMLIFGGENDSSALSRVAAFKDEFKRLGWNEGRNVVIDVRFAGGNPDRFRAYAAELVSLAPDLIVPQSGASTRAVQALTKTIPLIFVEAGDPVAGGLVQNAAHPEGNSTGITNLFGSIGGKWLELLREAAPHVTRVMLLVNAELGGGAAFLPTIEAAAMAYGIDARRFPYRNADDIERAMSEFAVEPNGGVIVVPPTPTESDMLVVKRALTRHHLPAVYQYKLAIEIGGGLISYGPDTLDLYRGAAAYADRILRGAKPGDLPVQFSTKFELVINLKAAKAIGLTIPEAFLLRADEVIE
jgi:putative ABC transport system substrate-binding protein